MLKQKLGIVSIIGTSLPLLLLTGNGAIAANLIQNGSFEMGTDPGSFLNISAGSTDINNWVVTADVDYIGTAWQASDGQRSIDLNGTGQGEIAQTFNTNIGQTYTVTFDLAGNSNGSPNFKEMRIQAAGQSANFTFDATETDNNNMGWTPQSWEFTANGAQTTLSFSGLNATGAGPVIDNVAIIVYDEVIVPEPVTILGSLTLLGFGTLMKRQKAQELWRVLIKSTLTNLN